MVENYVLWMSKNQALNLIHASDVPLQSVHGLNLKTATVAGLCRVVW